MRRPQRLQDRCQNIIAPGGRFLREKFSSSNENPHGFELPRTLSCKPRKPRSAWTNRENGEFSNVLR